MKCKGWLDGVHGLDVVNIAMIILSYISLSLKYGYDQFIEDKVTQAKQSLIPDSKDAGFVDFSTSYIFYESLALLDSLLIFLMSLSILKYTFFWIPSLATLTTAFRAYLSSTLRHLAAFLLLLALAFSLYFHYFYAYVCYGFFDLGFSMVRTSLLFVQGPLINKNEFYLVVENMEYVYARVGWGAVIINIGLVHLFGRHIVMNIIVAFLKKDLSEAMRPRKAIEKK